MRTFVVSLFSLALLTAAAPALSTQLCEPPSDSVKKPAPKAGATTCDIDLDVQGMTCNGCANKATRVLSALPTVYNVSVVFDKNAATLSASGQLCTDGAPLVAALKSVDLVGKVKTTRLTKTAAPAKK